MAALLQSRVDAGAFQKSPHTIVDVHMLEEG